MEKWITVAFFGKVLFYLDDARLGRKINTKLSVNIRYNILFTGSVSNFSYTIINFIT